MLWVTKRKIRIARAATCWLIGRVDPEGEIRFLEDAEVTEWQDRGAIGFHATGARYPALDDRGRIAFEAITEEYLPGDKTMERVGSIVHDADRPRPNRKPAPEAAGLRAISVSFPNVCSDDAEIVRLTRLLYDALYYTISKLPHA